MVATSFHLWHIWNRKAPDLLKGEDYELKVKHGEFLWKRPHRWAYSSPGFDTVQPWSFLCRQCRSQMLLAHPNSQYSLFLPQMWFPHCRQVCGPFQDVIMSGAGVPMDISGSPEHTMQSPVLVSSPAV